MASGRTRDTAEFAQFAAFVLVLIIISATAFQLSLSFPNVSKQLPRAVSLVLIATSLLVLAREGAKRRSRNPDDGPQNEAARLQEAAAEGGEPDDPRRRVRAFGLLFGFAALAYLIGLLPASLVVLLCGALLLGAKPVHALLLTVVGGAVMYLFFVELLEVRIKSGLLI